MSATIEVVAAAIVRDGRVLAARRAPGHRLAGGWEFPGGKVEPDEPPRAALERECSEELGIGVAVDELLDVATSGEIRLTLFAVRLAEGEPEPIEDHDELRWLDASELDSVAWLPIDVELLPVVAELLRARDPKATA